MVVGNGMIANTFKSYRDDNDVIIFASGVSNSKDTNAENYRREFELLKEIISQHPLKTLVYFSTCSVEDKDLASSPYVIHKKAIEDFIRENAESFYLFRVSNLAGVSNNPYTLLNYFIFNILREQPLNVWQNAYRNIIGVEDMYSIANYFLQLKESSNKTINIANTENYSVPYILKQIESHLNKKGVYNTIEKGDDYVIDTSSIKPIIQKLHIEFNDDYLPSLLKKYYHSK